MHVRLDLVGNLREALQVSTHAAAVPPEANSDCRTTAYGPSVDVRPRNVGHRT